MNNLMVRNSRVGVVPQITISLLTGGADRPYVFGLATALIAKGVALDVIGSDDLDFPEFHGNPAINFLNIRGDQRPNVSFIRKAFRVGLYYVRLICYAATAKPQLFHIVWNNKVQIIDRTILMLYYRLLGKKIVFTAHNVNAARRDAADTWLNRLTLRIQYRLSDRIVVHTQKMKKELTTDFNVIAAKVTVMPFGINNAVPHTNLTPGEAKQCLGIRQEERTILFFGNITPYKGLEYLVDAFRNIRTTNYRLIIAGRANNCDEYWAPIRARIAEHVPSGSVLLRDEFIPDKDVEVYLKAADILVLPYKHVYQSGVMFLGYSFGTPVLAADVGSLREEIREGYTGFLFKPEDSADLAKAIEKFFASDLYTRLSHRRQKIKEYATERHSWEAVSQIVIDVYRSLLHRGCHEAELPANVASSSLEPGKSRQESRIHC